jgi:hypothetical protein
MERVQSGVSYFDWTIKWLKSYNSVDVTSCGNLQWNLKKASNWKSSAWSAQSNKVAAKEAREITGLVTAIAIASSGEWGESTWTRWLKKYRLPAKGIFGTTIGPQLLYSGWSMSCGLSAGFTLGLTRQQPRARGVWRP